MKRKTTFLVLALWTLLAQQASPMEVDFDLCGNRDIVIRQLEHLEDDLNSISQERLFFKRLYEYGIGVSPGWSREPVHWDKNGNRLHIFLYKETCGCKIQTISILVTIDCKSLIPKVMTYLSDSPADLPVIEDAPSLRERILRTFECNE